MEIGQSTWSHQTVVLSERVGSEEEIFLTQSSFGGSLEPSTPMDFLRQSSDESHCKEDQENVVIAKKGKKRGMKAITSFQINNPYL